MDDKAICHVAAGKHFSLALSSLKLCSVFSFGDSGSGQLGLGFDPSIVGEGGATSHYVFQPTQVPFYELTRKFNIVDMCCGAEHSMVMSHNGEEVYTWGTAIHSMSGNNMATGHRARRGQEIYYPTKLEMRTAVAVGNNDGPFKVIGMAGGENTSLFLVQNICGSAATAANVAVAP